MRYRTFKRQELYELVWAEPMTAVAKRIGISDRGLAKACARGDVPVPERGYWQRLEAGQKVLRPPLPAASNSVSEVITINLWSQITDDPVAEAALDTPELQMEIERELTPGRAIAVPTLGKRHSLAEAIQRNLKDQKADKYGAVACQGHGLMHVRVSPETVPRAVAILDALLKGVEARGWRMEIRHDTIGSSFWVGAENFHFAIDEHVRRIDHVETDKEKATKEKAARNRGRPDAELSLMILLQPKWDFVPTGELTLTVQGPVNTGISNKFRDTAATTLESRLNEAMVCVRRMAAIGAAQRVVREQHERERLARQAAAAEERQRQEAERARKAALLEEATMWRRADDLRRYIAKAETRALSNGDDQDRTSIGRWAAWARTCADEIDPIEKRPWRPKE